MILNFFFLGFDPFKGLPLDKTYYFYNKMGYNIGKTSAAYN